MLVLTSGFTIVQVFAIGTERQITTCPAVDDVGCQSADIPESDVGDLSLLQHRRSMKRSQVDEADRGGGVQSEQEEEQEDEEEEEEHQMSTLQPLAQKRADWGRRRPSLGLIRWHPKFAIRSHWFQGGKNKKKTNSSSHQEPVKGKKCSAGEISFTKAGSLSNCKAKCDSESKCKFYTYYANGGCATWTTCDFSKKAHGVTYPKSSSVIDGLSLVVAGLLGAILL